MEKEITIKEFYQELKGRIEQTKTIDCCKDEIVRLAELAAEKMPDQKIVVQWKD